MRFTKNNLKRETKLECCYANNNIMATRWWWKIAQNLHTRTHTDTHTHARMHTHHTSAKRDIPRCTARCTHFERSSNRLLFVIKFPTSKFIIHTVVSLFVVCSSDAFGMMAYLSHTLLRACVRTFVRVQYVWMYSVYDCVCPSHQCCTLVACLLDSCSLTLANTHTFPE